MVPIKWLGLAIHMMRIYLCLYERIIPTFNANLQIRNVTYALQILDYKDQQAFVENEKVYVLD